MARRRSGAAGLPALATLCAVLFLTFLDNTVVSVTLANIQSSLHSGITQLQWIVDGYLLAFAGLMLSGGTLGDLLGRKKVMLAGVALFCGGSLIAALAAGNGLLIAGRVVMGVGAAASEPGTLSMIRHLYPDPARRARALGAWTAVSGVALALGPIIGGALVAASDWRAVFWFNVVFGALALASGAAVLPESSDPQGRRLDVPGLLAGCTAVTAATFAVIEGESAGYGRWWVVLLFVVSAAAAVSFVLIERRSRDPVLRLEFFRLPAFTAANIAAFATSFGIFAVFFFTALYLQLVSSFSAGKIALEFLGMAAAIAVAALGAGRWTARRGPREPLTVGCLLAGAGLLWVDSLLGPRVATGTLALALTFTGLGFGLALVALTEAVLGTVPGERSGMAASAVNTSRQLGGVFAVAVLGAIVDAQLTGNLVARLRQLGIPPNFQALVVEAVTHGAVPSPEAGAHNAAAAGHEALVVKVIQAAQDAFGKGLHISLLLAGAMLFSAAAVSLLAIHRQPLAASSAAPSHA